MASAEEGSEGGLAEALGAARTELEAGRLAGEALAADRERLRITLASIGDGVISTDAEGRVTFLNPVAEALTGWPNREAAGRPLAEIFHIVNQYTRAEVENPALRALREGIVVGLANHTILIARDGTERPIDDSAAPMFDGGGRTIGAVLVFRDVTERSRAHEARARLAAIVESSDDAIVSKDLDGVVLSWNTGAERLFGWSRREAVGRKLAELIIPPDRLGEEESILARLRRGERVEPFETIRVRKDGRRVEISATMSPVRDDEGRVVAASKIARDVTAARAAERALRASEGRLRLMVDLGAAVHRAADPDEATGIATRLLAEHLGADLGLYAEAAGPGPGLVAAGAFAREGSGLGAGPALDGLIAEVARRLSGDGPFAVEDAECDPSLGASREAFRAAGVRSALWAPLHKDGRLIAAIGVHQAAPRSWSPEDAILLRTVVDRCWEALERARVTRDLRASEAQYRAIVETTPECVKLVDAEGRLLQMNSAGLGMIEAEAGLAIGRSVYAAVAPEHRDAFIAFNERICRGESGRMEFEIVGLNGTRRHMESTAVPMPAPGGGFHQLAVSRDVTERVRSERALAESRARVDYAARAAGLGFWYCDLPFGELTWDDRVKEHFHFPPDARVTIEMFYDRLHPEDREPTRRSIETSIERGLPFDIDYRTVHPASGDVKWIRALGGASYAADGSPTRFDGVTVDATDRKRDEERLARLLGRERERTRLLRRMSDAALAIHAAGSLEDVVRAVASEARRVVGARRAIAGLAAGDDARPLEAVSEADAAGEPAGEGPGRAPGRSRIAVPFLGRDGRALGRIELADKSEGEFTESDEAVLVQLAHVAAVAVENARLYAELREEDRRKVEFLAMLAHELRNPLAPLRNGLQLMRQAELPGPVEWARDMMGRQLNHMVRLIDDLLDVSRINQNKLELRRGRVELEEVVAAAVETARPLIESSGHALSVDLPPGPIALDADLMRLAQVFGNLLTNAAKYTPPGGRIALSARREADEVVVAVRDDGLGVPAEALAGLFDMFSQVDRGVERSAGGLGIGLALVKGLVEMHGGTVAAASDGPNRGSTFTVRLPAPAPAGTAEAGPESDAPAPPATAVAGRRILVVDDSRDSASSMAALLELLGAEVRTAHDGVEAVEAAEAFRPDVILMDVGMPRLNGYDATRRIREAEWGRRPIVIALTGWGQPADRALSREAGCDAHLVKPVDVADLERLLAESPPRD